MTKPTWAGIILMVMLSTAAFCQDSQFHGSEFAGVPLVIDVDKLPEFDVADIQVSKIAGGPNAQFLPGGKVVFQALPLKFMVLAAWGWENDESRVTGGPSWVNSEKFDVVAKAPPTAQIVDLRLRLRSLLIKRFGLEFHVKDEPLPVYLLEKSKGAPKVTQSEKEAPPDCKRSNENGLLTMTCHNMTMDELANGLRGMAPAYVDKPVINATGLMGQFDFKLGWTPRGRLMGEGRGAAADSGPRPDGSILSASDASGITVFEGVDKYLGLRLNSGKHPLPVIVIDKVNRTPTEN